MGAVSNILSVAGVGMSVYRSHDDYREKKREAELAATGMEDQAARKDLEAGEARKIGALKMAEQDIAGRAAIAGRKIAYAAGGVRVDSGSAMEMAADQAAWNEFDRQKIQYEYDLRSWGLDRDAALLRREAAKTRAAGQTSGFNRAESLVNAGQSILKI